MRFYSLSTFIIALFSACSGNSNSVSNQNEFNLSSNDYQEIKTVLDSQVSAWNNGDIKEFMKGYWNSDSLRFIGRKGVRYGYQAVETNYLKHYNSKEKMGFLSFDSLEYHQISGNDRIANVTGQWKISGKDSSGGFFSLFFKKTDHNWKITIDHTW